MARMTRMTRMARIVACMARWLADLADPFNSDFMASGMIKDAHNALHDVQSSGRAKELLAQVCVI